MGARKYPSWLGFVGAKFGFSCAGMLGKAWVAKMVKIESRGFGILSELKCAKCHKNEVAKVWWQKDSILVGFCGSQVWIFMCRHAWEGMGGKNGEN